MLVARHTGLLVSVGLLSLFAVVLVYDYSTSLSIYGGDGLAHGTEGWPALRAFERRGVKRWAEAWPHSGVAPKPLPWERDLEHIVHHRPTAPPPVPAPPAASASFARRSLQDVASLDDLMTQYAALHKRILERQQAPRYVVFVANPEFGYGNKIQVLASTFVFALMSERAILKSRDVTITHRKDVKGAASLVTNIDHRELLDPPHGIQWHLTPQLRSRFYNVINSTVAKRFTSFATSGVCQDLYEWEHYAEWVYIDHWDYFAAMLLNNAHHGYINRLLTPFHDELLYVLANALRVIQPTRSVKLAVESIRDHLFDPHKDEGILGIHMRTTHPEISVDDNVMAQMIRCGLASGYRVWYLATEDKEWRDRFGQLLLQLDPAGAEDMSRVKLLFLEANVTERNTIEGMRHAMNEMFLLMACDDFMSLWGTTFGRLVASIGGFKEPIVVMKHKRACVRKLTSEPCIYEWNHIKAAPCYQGSMQLPHMIYSSGALCREI